MAVAATLNSLPWFDAGPATTRAGYAHGSLVPAIDDNPVWRIAKGSQTIVFGFASLGHELKSLSSVTGTPPVEFGVVDNAVLAGFDRLRAFRSWKNNWDAEGGCAPDPLVVDAATRVYSLLAQHNLPTVDLTPEGMPQFLYDGLTRGEVVVTSDTTLGYFFADGGPADEDVSIVGGALPPDLVEHLAQHA
jgi:hypothetical protein